VHQFSTVRLSDRDRERIVERRGGVVALRLQNDIGRAVDSDPFTVSMNLLGELGGWIAGIEDLDVKASNAA